MEEGKNINLLNNGFFQKIRRSIKTRLLSKPISTKLDLILVIVNLNNQNNLRNFLYFK